MRFERCSIVGELRAVGIGDDAALVDVPRGDTLVASVDSAMENRHFRRDWLTPREIGYRAVTAALSDLAAMAARPIGVLVALAIPDAWRAELLSIADGIGDALTAANTVIRGGNISHGPPSCRSRRRSSARHSRRSLVAAPRAGDRVYVTGELGGPRAALQLLDAGESPARIAIASLNRSRESQEARWLAEHGAHAAIDISDGLDRRSAAYRRGSVGGHRRSTPRAFRRVAGVDIENALVSGEEYELVVAVARGLRHAALRAAVRAAADRDRRRLAPCVRTKSVSSALALPTPRATITFRHDADSVRGLDDRRHDAAARARRDRRARCCASRRGRKRSMAAAFALWARSITVRRRRRGRRSRRRASGQSRDGAVFVANHVSWFDVFALASVVPWCSFVAKSELRQIPVFGFAAEAAGIVFIDRENRKQAFESYEVAAKEVRRGRAIVVCPEGTRGCDYHLRPFKKGPFVLAIAAQSPVIPTVVHGTIEVMPKGSFWIRSGGRIDLHFLEPIPTIGCDYEHRAELMTATWTRWPRRCVMYMAGRRAATVTDPVANRGASGRLALPKPT